VGVAPCRFHALMAEQFLDGSDVVAVFDEMCCKGEPIGGVACQLGEASTADGPPDGPLKWLYSLELEDTEFLRFSASAERQNLNPDDTAILTKVQNHAGLNFLRLDNLRLVQPEVKRIVLPVNFQSHIPFPKRRSKKTVTIR